jgi:hypothetical protein
VSSTLVQNYLDCTIVFEPDFTRVGGSNLAGLIATGLTTDKSLRFGNVNGQGPWSVSARNPGDLNDWAGGTPGGATNYYVNGELGQRLVNGWNILGGSRTNVGANFPANFAYHLAAGLGGRYFQGKIAAVLLYNRRLSRQEQQQNYDALAPRFRLPARFPTTFSLPTDGLILNVDAADPNSYPGYGNIWYDTASGNQMRLLNNPTYDPTGPKSIIFNGSNQYAISSVTRNFPQRHGAIMGWANPSANGGDHYVICLGDANTGLARGIRINATNWSTVSYGSSDQDFNSIASGPNSTWQHVAYVWRDTRRVEFYLNGKIYYSFKIKGSPSGSIVTVGSYSFPPGGGLWNGRIASAQVYERSLEANEIQTIFQSQRLRFGV